MPKHFARAGAIFDSVNFEDHFLCLVEAEEPDGAMRGEHFEFAFVRRHGVAMICGLKSQRFSMMNMLYTISETREVE